jgi:hypothetical protein
MAALSNFLENKLIDLLFRGVSYAGPSAVYIALYTAAPTAAGGGTEVTGGSYARVALSPSPANWAATNGATLATNPSTGTSGATSNNVAIVFPTATASWGTVTSVAILDAPTGGNQLFFGVLNSPQTIATSGSFSFAISALAPSMS